MKTSQNTQKTYLSLHTWTGIVCGLALFICFFAGSLTVFSSTLSEWATPTSSIENTQTTTIEKLPTLIRLASEQHPNMRKQFIVHWPTDSQNGARLSWRKKNKKQRITVWASLSKQGTLVTQEQRQYPLGKWIDKLHETAGIPGSGHNALGLKIMGVISGLYFIALVSGLILFLPRMAKDWLSLRVKSGYSSTRRAWLDAHNLFGITGLPFHLMIAFTVVVFAYHDPIYSAIKHSIYKDTPLFPSMEQTRQQSEDPILTMSTPSQWVDKVHGMSPHFVVTRIRYSNMVLNSPKPPLVIVYGGNHHNRVNSFAIFNGETGQTSFNYINGNTQQAIVKSFFAMHFGNFGGVWMRWVYFLLGLAGAALFYTGNVLWLEKRHTKSQQQGLAQPINLRIMAALTVGVCFGSILSVTTAMAAVRIASSLSNHHMAISTLFWSVYYSLFLGSVILSIWLGANRTVVPLILSCAFGCSSITLASILTTRQYDVSWSVETTATLLCFGFILMAYKTHKRLSNAPMHNLWSY